MKTRHGGWAHVVVGWSCWLACVLTSPLLSANQSSPPSAASTSAETISLDQLRSLQSKAAARLREAESRLSEQGEPPGNAQQQTQVELLRYLELTYAQREGAIESRAILTDEIRSAEDRLRQIRASGPTEQGPFSFLTVDDLRSEAASAAVRLQLSANEIEAAEGLVAAARHQHDEAETERRRAREQAEAAPGDDHLHREHELAKLFSEVHSQVVQLRLDQITILRRRHDLNKLRADYLQEKVDAIGSNVTFSEADLQLRLQELEDERNRLTDAVGVVRQRLIEAERQSMELKQKATGADVDDELAQVAITAWQKAREIRQAEVTLTSQLASDVVVLKFFWNCRYQVFNKTATVTETRGWKEDAERFLDRQNRIRLVLESRLEEYRNESALLRQRLETVRDTSAAHAGWIEFQLAELRRVTDQFGDALVDQKLGYQAVNHLLDDLGRSKSSGSTVSFLKQAWSILLSCWQFEMLVVEDQPLTVGKLVFGFLFLLLGFRLSSLVSRLLGRRVFPRLKVDEGGRAALETVAYYAMLIVFGFVGLELINIPITIFAFLGGAIAIGVGFGSQNILNNFISGLILLAERPIRQGDLVEVDGLYGTVEQIGARSTRVRTGSNREIIVPNSKFLENNVTNLTLSDTRTRVCVTVGVAYGSPTRDVERIMKAAVQSSPDVLDSPEPIVLFQEFGDNALTFEIHFWIQMRTMMQSHRIESDVRFAIDELAREADITIAFPQRDVHLDLLKPLDVNLRHIRDDRRRPDAPRPEATTPSLAVPQSPLQTAREETRIAPRRAA